MRAGILLFSLGLLTVLTAEANAEIVQLTCNATPDGPPTKELSIDTTAATVANSYWGNVPAQISDAEVSWRLKPYPVAGAWGSLHVLNRTTGKLVETPVCGGVAGCDANRVDISWCKKASKIF